MNRWSIEAGRLRAASLADHLGRHAGNGLVVGHRTEHHRARRDACAMSDLDIAEDFGACTDKDPAADFRVAVAGLLAGAAERDAVQHRYVVFDHSRFAHNEPGGMVEEDAAADARIWMNVALEHRGGAALQVEMRDPCVLCPIANARADASGWHGSL